MTDITSTAAASATGITQSLTGGTAAGETSDAAANTDFDDFLTLLTAQMRNQDPLNPADSTEFVTQLATFTGVEQQVTSNNKLDELIALQTGDQLAQLGAWIGQTVTAPNAGFFYDGTTLDVTVPADGNAETASVTIRDSSGREVDTISADPEGGVVTWDGKSASGAQQPSGLYRIEYTYGRSGDEGPETWSLPAEGQGRVIEARMNGGSGELVLDSGAIVDPGAVTSVRAGDAAASDDEGDAAS